MFGRAFGSATRGARAAFFRARLTRGLSSVKARPAFARFGAVAAFAAGAAMASSVAFAAEEKNSQAAGPTGEVPLPALINPNEFSNLVVVFHEKVNDNTHMLVLSAPDSAHVEMPTASFVLVRVKVGDKEEVRPYTPVFCKDGLIALMIKEYPDGVVSKHLANLPEGATVEVKGFIPKIAVTDGFKKNVGLIAGGSGITPMFQVIKELLSGDKTKISLIYANVEERDIWFKDAFDWASEEYPDKFRAVYFLEKPPAGWTGETGRVTKEALEKYLPPPSNDSLVMVCGPPGMMKAVSGPKTKDYKQGEVEGILKELGYTSDQVFKF